MCNLHSSLNGTAENFLKLRTMIKGNNSARKKVSTLCNSVDSAREEFPVTLKNAFVPVCVCVYVYVHIHRIFST